ncbi:MAG TPA: LuxR C-terminal-related transcriptional regulator, partial [Candidatus Limnocylindrales bacterium]
LLEPYRERAEANGWADERIRAMTLEVLAHEAAGATDLAAAAFSAVARVAEPEGFVRLFLDEGPAMGRLLRRLVSGPDGAFAGRLLGLIREAHTTGGDGRGSTEASGLAEPLTPRELELVGLIAEGLTNAQIADRLYLSPHTVKVHTRNIYGKLGAESRTQAVATARRLNLLAG